MRIFLGWVGRARVRRIVSKGELMCDCDSLKRIWVLIYNKTSALSTMLAERMQKILNDDRLKCVFNSKKFLCFCMCIYTSRVHGMYNVCTHIYILLHTRARIRARAYAYTHTHARARNTKSLRKNGVFTFA